MIGDTRPVGFGHVIIDALVGKNGDTSNMLFFFLWVDFLAPPTTAILVVEVQLKFRRMLNENMKKVGTPPEMDSILEEVSKETQPTIFSCSENIVDPKSAKKLNRPFLVAV
ncbi:hypothetical protein Fot_31978 [Forsythia ovata]|uniref:Uncharacterized protein n=1 Tax=Forsythia ovata TaxID=205694 RepID=A0ABD1T6R0_9LAMI